MVRRTVEKKGRGWEVLGWVGLVPWLRWQFLVWVSGKASL